MTGHVWLCPSTRFPENWAMSAPFTLQGFARVINRLQQPRTAISTLDKRIFSVKSRIALVLLTIFALVGSPIQSIAAPETVKLTVHYNRPGGDYTGWNLWIWKNSDNNSLDTPISSTGVAFTGQDDFGKTVTVTLADMKNFKDVGIIVRLNDWAAKDVDQDRFISTFDSNGNAEVWLVQNDKTIYYQKPDIQLKYSIAAFDDLDKVRVEVNKKFNPSSTDGNSNGGFTINGAEVTKVTAGNGDSAGASVFFLTLKSPISLEKKYTLSHPSLGSTEIQLGEVISTEAFEARYTYKGDDLGNTYSKSQTNFRVWAPTATAVSLVTYASAEASTGTSYAMTADLQGTWKTSLIGDKDGLIYTYKVSVGGEVNEVIDPYARAATINGARGVVVDLDSTDPQGWKAQKPAFSGNPTDALIYELHVRDLSMDKSAPFPSEVRGKFKGLTYSNLKGSQGQPVGVAAIKDLGITHVQLLPIYDFASVDEKNPSFNWGYDPLNYNVPEGSYSTNPGNPKLRITELKEGIQSLHNQGLRVMMDVVYNHVYNAATFSQSKIVPGYWFRTDSSGTLTSASGCGNDSASERSMVRKFIVDSVKYWASEYNLSGFRFDLMGLHDLETMKQIRTELNKIDPSIIVIGEGWDMGTHPGEIRANQRNIEQLPGISVFNDQIRDGIKGSVFSSSDTGFATGKSGQNNNVKAGIVGNIDFGRGILPNFTNLAPYQSVNYVEAHDNNTLDDKIRLSIKSTKDVDVARFHRFAGSIPILSQGIPFIHAGQEFRRSKSGDSNSYQSGDEINSLKWDLVTKNAETRNYYKGLIQLRTQHNAFRMTTSEAVKANLSFIKTGDSIIAYSLNGKAVGDKWTQVVVIHNAGSSAAKISLPTKGNWNVVVEGAKAGVKVLRTLKATNSVSAIAQSTTVLYRS